MNINLLANVNRLSYGIVGLNFVRALQSKGVNVALFPIAGQVECDPKYHDSIRQAIAEQEKFDYFASSVRIWHQFALAEQVGKGRKVGFPIFELDNFTVREKHHLQMQDLIFVPSSWASRIVAERTSVHEDKVHVVPLGVDRNIYNEKVKPIYERKNDKFRVLNVGKLETRKGHDVLHEIFAKAFPDEKDVELLVSWHNPFLPPEEIASFEQMYKETLGDKVKFIPWLQTEDEVASLMKYADIGLFPTRSEGWCLPILNMMSLGKRVVHTGYSAIMDYSSGENFSVSINRLEPAFDGKWFNGNVGNWAMIDKRMIAKFAENLRYLYDLWKAGRLGEVSVYNIEMAKEFTWECSADAMINALLK